MFIGLGFGILAFAQEQSQSTDNVALETRVAKALSDYQKWKSDITGKPEVIQQLKMQVESTEARLRGQTESAQEQLAKLGEIEQIHEIVCQLYAKGPQAQLDATRMLSSVGGYAAIDALARVMLENPPYHRSPPGHYFSMRTYALGVLSKLIPELKVPLITPFVPPPEQQFRDWYDWIQEHRAQLGQLQPSDGGNLTEIDCARLRRRDFSLQDVASIQISSFSPTANGANRHDYTISNRDGRFLIDTREIDKSIIEGLATALSDPIEDQPDLPDLGITEAWLSSNAHAALRDLPVITPTLKRQATDKSEFTAEDKREFLKLFSDMETMNGILHGTFLSESGSPSFARVRLAIQLRDGQTIHLWSQGSEFLLLPWVIQGQEYRKLFDYRISQALARLLPRDAPNFDRFSATGTYSFRQHLATALFNLIRSECFKKPCQSINRFQNNSTGSSGNKSASALLLTISGNAYARARRRRRKLAA